MNVNRKGESVELSLTPHEAALVAGAISTAATLFAGDKDMMPTENVAFCAELGLMTGAASLSQAELEFAKNALANKARNPKDVDVLIARVIERQKAAMKTVPGKG